MRELSRTSLESLPGSDTQHVDVWELHVRLVAAFLAELLHWFPNGHHFGMFVGAIDRAVALVENLEVDRLAVVLLFAFEVVRRVVGDEPGS